MVAHLHLGEDDGDVLLSSPHWAAWGGYSIETERSHHYSEDPYTLYNRKLAYPGDMGNGTWYICICSGHHYSEDPASAHSLYYRKLVYPGG